MPPITIPLCIHLSLSLLMADISSFMASMSWRRESSVVGWEGGEGLTWGGGGGC